ncbi:MAG TPA: hypothetical protein VGU27_04875, partial [Candidatus Eisenbacteria bacterium]|nr:hypothetical protein [Candidatus Eisenbacteria bacterium]
LRPGVYDEDLAAGRLVPAPAARAPRAAVEGGPGPANVLVNDKSHDGTSSAQSEEDVAMLGLNGICAWNNGQGFFSLFDTQGFGYTTNGGATWTNVGIPHPPGVQNMYWFSDPVVTVNQKTGEFYYTGLTSPNSSTDGVSVARGHFAAGAFVWDSVTVVRTGPNTQIFFDKEWMAADSASGNLYLTYTSFGVNGDSIVFQRSTDGGSHWDSPQVVNTSGFGSVQGSRPAVGPNGEVYVTWQEFGATNDFMDVRTSTDQGVTFGSQVNAASVWSNDFSGAPGFNRSSGITFPSIAVDRSPGFTRGRVYLAWNEGLDILADPLGGSGVVNEVESNDRFASATPFTPGQRLRGGLTRLDLDYWSFPATQGTTYVFFLNSLTSTLNYTLRVFCGADTLTRLAFTGDPDSTVSSGGTSLIEWTAPSTGTYYLRVAQSAGTGTYQIVTGTHLPVGGERARDHRDVFASTSTDRGATWSTPVRMNDDATGFDDWLPEIAVSTEGYAYSMWFDWRDATANCGGSSNIYVSRSTDNGTTWAANQKITTAATAWTRVGSNIAPNQGDYLGLSGGGVVMYSWADGRLGDPDVFSGNLAAAGVGATLVCPADSTWDAGSAHRVVATVQHPNTVWDDPYTLRLTSARAWAGFPQTQGILQPAATTTGWFFNVSVPDTAAPGTDRVCLQLVQPNGLAIDSCCFTVTVNAVTAVGPGGGPDFGLRGAWPNPGRGRLAVAFALAGGGPATLELLDLAGRRVLVRDVGGLGPGLHVLDLSREAAALPAGVYTTRLAQAGRVRTGKVTLVR